MASPAEAPAATPGITGGSVAAKATKKASEERRLLPRHAAWVASLRNALKEHCRGRVLVTSAEIPGDNEAEIDGLLTELWERYACDGRDASTSFANNIAELKYFYEQKLREIARKEAEYIGPASVEEKALPQDSPDVIEREIKRTLKCSAKRKFSALRLRVKKEILKTIRILRDTYADTSGVAKRRLPSNATKAMNSWFESHLSNPYPSDAEKEGFAAKYGITVDQVTTWFTNKRHRSQKRQ